MQPFFRFVLLFLVLGIALGLTLVTATNQRNQTLRRQVESSERDKLGKHFREIQDLVRAADLVVERQTTAGDQRVIQSTLLFCPYGWDTNDRPIPLPARRFTIAGDRVSIDGERIDCPQGILDDGFPLANPSHDKSPGVNVTMFGHVYGSEDTPDDLNMLVPFGIVQPGYRPDPDVTSEFERQVWQRLGEFNTNDALARRCAVQLHWFPAVSTRVRPGIVYRVFLDPIDFDAKLQLRIEELDDPKQVGALLLRTPTPPLNLLIPPKPSPEFIDTPAPLTYSLPYCVGDDFSRRHH